MKLIGEIKVGLKFNNDDFQAIKKELNKKFPLNLDTPGSTINKFEKKFAKYVGKKYAVSMSSCTAALRVAAMVLNIKKNDEVIICTHTFWNTVVPFLEFGAKFKIIDTKKNSLSIDEKILKKNITKKTKAVIIWGHGGMSQRSDIIYKICKKKKIALIDDCAHSLGSYFKKKHAGYYSDIATFSFSTQKNITTLGEGGMFVTNDLLLAKKARGFKLCFPVGDFKKMRINKFNNYLKPKRTFFMRPGQAYEGEFTNIDKVGTNYKMTNVQAAVGISQLTRIKKILYKRRKIASIYDNFISNNRNLFEKFVEEKNSINCFHLYSVRIKKNKYFTRNELISFFLDKYKIELRNRFFPINYNPAIKKRLVKKIQTPYFDKIWFEEMISFPIASSMSLIQAKNFINCLKKFIVSKK